MTTQVEVTKLTMLANIGPPVGAAVVSKLVMYVRLVPGTEVGATPPAYKAYTYGQILNKPNPVGAR